MGVVSLLEAVMGTSVDTKGLEDGLQKSERLAEEGTQKIAKHFDLMAVGIVSAIAGTVIVALEKAIHTTAEWGLEMEHLGSRMGLTSTEAATFVGIMERFGVQSGIAARSMQVLAQQVKQTQESLDPFNTRIGKTLGTLRDTSGAALNMGQVMDLVRQKISAAATDSEKLQIAQSLLGARIGGQLVGALKSSNAEWERLKTSVIAAQGPVEEAAQKALAYKQATAELEQTFRGLEITIGTKLLPVITDVVKSFSELVSWFKDLKGTGIGAALEAATGPFRAMKTAIDAIAVSLLYVAEKLHIVEKGAVDAYQHMDQYKDAAQKAALEADKLAEGQEAAAQAAELTEKRAKELVQLQKEQVSLAEKARALGLGNEKAVQEQVEAALQRLTTQRELLQKELNTPGVSADTRLKLETDITKNRIEAAEIVARAAADQYKNEELQIKANGAASLSSELGLLQKKIADERIVGDERLKLEGEIFEKRKQYTEQAIQVGRQLGFVSIQQEIDYRKQQAAQKLGQGDALGAAQEVVKARDLAIKQADQVMEFTKKIRTVSLQSEIEYNKQKLQLVKGNAEEEMQIIGQIATLDKQLYDKRLQAALTYTQNAISAYRELQKATGKDTSDVSGKGESLTFAQADREAERARYQNARTLEEVAQHGGTEEARSTAVKQSQDILKTAEEMKTIGKTMSDGFKAQVDAARDLLKSANEGEEVRAPGGPSPVAASLLSPEEGLSTAGLNRGSDIPRLDTSFTDLAIRVRDVLLGTVPNIQNFSNAVASATAKIAGVTGFQSNPGAVGPGGGLTNLPTQGSATLATGQGTPATVAPGQAPVQPTPSVGIGVGGFAQSDLASKIDDLIASLDGLPDKVSSSLQDQSAANAQSLQDSLNAVLANRSNDVKVNVGIDPNTGDLIVANIVKEIGS